MRMSILQRGFYTVLFSSLLVACGDFDINSSEKTTPEATITFPDNQSSTTANTTKFRGTLTANGNTIDAVTLNGHAVSSSDQFANWSLTTELAPGTNDLDLVISYQVPEDEQETQLLSDIYLNDSHKTLTADRSRIDSKLWLEAPQAIHVDNNATQAWIADATTGQFMQVDLATGGTRLIADSVTGTGPVLDTVSAIWADAASERAWVVDNSLNALIEVDLSNGNRTTISGSNNGSGTLFSGLTSLSVDVSSNFAWVSDSFALYEVNLANGNRRVVASNSVGAGDTFASIQDIWVDADNNIAWAIDRTNIALYEIDLNTGDRTVLSGTSQNPTPSQVGAGPIFVAPNAITGDLISNTLWVSDVSLDAIFSVDINTGDRTLLSDATLGTGDALSSPQGMAFDRQNNQIVVVDSIVDAVFTVANGSGNRTLLSSNRVGEGTLLEYMRSIDVDPAAGLAWVADSDVDGIVEIDLYSGTRRIISNDTTGTGDTFSRPVDLQISADHSLAWVTDTSLDAIFEVDMATGNRRILSDSTIGSGPLMVNTKEIVVDAANNVAYGLDSSLQSLLRINLTNGDREVLIDASSNAMLLFNSFRGLVMNEDFTKAWVGETNAALQLFDLTAGTVSAVSDNSNLGTGPVISILNDVAVNSDATIAYVLNIANLLEVDLATGNRTLVSGFDFDSSTTVGSGLAFDDPESLTIDWQNQIAWVADRRREAIIKVDLVTGNRIVIAK